MLALSLAVFALGAAAGFFLLALGLPGIWLLAAAAVAAAALHPAVNVTLGMCAALAALGILAELLEALCAYFGAKRGGVSTPAVCGGLAGGLLGALALGALIPVLGAVPGAFLGTFLGAFGVELARGAARHEALKQGLSALLARLAALVVKLSVAAAMAALSLAWLL